MDEERKKVSLKYTGGRYALGLLRFFFPHGFWLEIDDNADSEIVCKKGFVLIVEV